MKGVLIFFSVLSLVMANITFSSGGITFSASKTTINGNEIRFEGDKLFVNGEEVDAEKNDKGEYVLDFLGSSTIRVGDKVLTGSSSGIKAPEVPLPKDDDNVTGDDNIAVGGKVTSDPEWYLDLLSKTTLPIGDEVVTGPSAGAEGTPVVDKQGEEGSINFSSGGITFSASKTTINGNEIRFEGDKLLVNGEEVEAQKNDKGEYVLDFLGSSTIRVGDKVVTGPSAGEDTHVVDKQREGTVAPLLSKTTLPIGEEGEESKTVTGGNPPSDGAPEDW